MCKHAVSSKCNSRFILRFRLSRHSLLPSDASRVCTRGMGRLHRGVEGGVRELHTPKVSAMYVVCAMPYVKSRD